MSSLTRVALVRLAALLVCMVGARPAAAQTTLYVTSRFTDEVLHYDLATGAFKGVFAAGGGLANPVGLTFGSDGHLYVASAHTNQVLRYHGATGAFLGVFAQGGGLDEPRQLNFGPGGDLFVANATTNSVLRFHGKTGAPLGAFASGGGISGPTSFTFGPDGDLYVGSVLTNRIKRFHGRTGAYLGNFVTANLNRPHDLSFGPDGVLYVSNASGTRLQRFDGSTGAFLGTFVNDARFAFPLGLCWDERGDLLVVNQGRNEVLRYDGRTGAPLGVVVAPGSGGLSAPLFACFEPVARTLRVRVEPQPVAGAPTPVVVDAAPGASVLLALDTAPQARRRGLPPWACPPPTADTLVELVADESGRTQHRWTTPTDTPWTVLRAFAASSCRPGPAALVRF